ncbi:RDD family protein [Oceanobacillus sp. CAU 1775]
MEEITKKRLKAILIDTFVSSTVTYTLEYFLRKKIKSEAFHALVTPGATQYLLEYAQLKTSGQTIGYRVMGLELQDETGQELTSKQILKRAAYRDTVSSIKYLKDRKAFEQAEGKVFPHDTYAKTIVREK